MPIALQASSRHCYALKRMWSLLRSSKWLSRRLTILWLGQTECQRQSAGVAVMARHWCGLGKVAVGQTVIAQGRAVIAQAQVPSLPQFAAVSVYLHDQEGFSERNVNILSAIGQHLSELGLPFIIGGDFNMAPELLASTDFAESLRGHITCVESSLGTYEHPNGCSNIDYFVTSSDMAAACRKVAIASDLPISKLHGHRGVRLTMALQPASLTKTVPVAVQRLPTEAVFGPRLPGQDWSHAQHLAEAAVRTARAATRSRDINEALATAYQEWARCAERSLADIMGKELHPKRLPRGVGLRLTEVPIFKDGDPKKELTSETVAMRWAQRWGLELLSLLRMGQTAAFADLLASTGGHAPAWMHDAGMAKYFTEIKQCAEATNEAVNQGFEEFSEAASEFEATLHAIEDAIAGVQEAD